MKKYSFLLFSVVLLLVTLSSSTRIVDVVEDFREKVSAYYHEKIASVLFLHTDKSIYIPNERIWFKAYLLDSSPLQHEVLYLRLVNEQKEIVLQKQFPVYDIRSNGDLLIPVTTAPGRYRIIAYTDKMISFNAENVFVQQIQVIKDQSFELKAEASFADSANFSPGKKPEIIVKVSADGQEIEKARGTYRIYTSDKKTITEGKFITGPGGVTILNFTYPVIAKNENLFLQFNVTDKDQSKELNIRLPKTTIAVSANYYPEGGHLVNGISNRVLIAVTNASGQPMIAKVALKSQAKQIATTATNIDGLALISFTPNIREKYSLEINNAGHLQTIAFPVKIDSAGYVIQLKGPPNHPVIIVKNHNMPENVFLLGRTQSDLKLNKKLKLKSGDSILITLPQNDSVNRVLDLGLFDTDNKLLAERLVYMPVPKKYRITFQFDKASYTSREKVRAEILVTDVNGNNVSANLSVAVVAKQTLDPAVQKRITETDLNTLRYYQSNLSAIEDINNALIREDIRTGSWASVMNYQAKGQIKMFSNAAGVFGTVISKRNKKIDLKELYLYGKSGIITVPVNANGTFSISSKDLITQRGETNYLIVNNDFNERYDLQIKEYTADFDTKFVMATLPESLPVYDLIKHSPQLSSVLSGRVLREVVIKGKKSTSVSSGDFNVTDYHSVNCSDYVCFHNILNCQNHKGGGMPPTEGQIYVLNGRPIKYYGCASKNKSKNNSYKIKNIDLPQTFYLPDYAKEPISAPELQSTIYWEPDLITHPNGKSTIEFYTSDIKGTFTIVVQGLTAKGLMPVFGKSDFTIIQNNRSK
jgi:hypothetical protein